ncbi:hypothetical protein [Mesorhizobium sp. M0633]|uniref:hypothetical protein n=1 Tax=Mesorhizobium sp. M0633 TaxID=2956977 RepID=UPI003335080B
MLPIMIMADVRQAYRTDNYAQTVIEGAIWPMLWPIYDDRPGSDRFEVNGSASASARFAWSFAYAV